MFYIYHPKKELRNFKDHIGKSATSHPLIGSNLFLKFNAQIPFLVLKEDTEIKFISNSMRRDLYKSRKLITFNQINRSIAM